MKDQGQAGEEVVQPQWEIKLSKDGAIPVIRNTFYGQDEMKVEEMPQSDEESEKEEEEEEDEEE